MDILKQGIYRLYNKKNGISYIGRSMDVEKRMKNHLRNLNKNTHINTKLQNDWNTYGENNFDFEVIEELASMENSRELESKYIAAYSKSGVYNVSDPLEEWNKKIDNVNHYEGISKVKVGSISFSGLKREIINNLDKELNALEDALANGKAKFYLKSVIDNALTERLGESVSQDDDRIPLAFHEVYSIYNNVTIYYPRHQKYLNKMGIVLDEKELIIVSLRTYEKLTEMMHTDGLIKKSNKYIGSLEGRKKKRLDKLMSKKTKMSTASVPTVKKISGENKKDTGAIKYFVDNVFVKRPDIFTVIQDEVRNNKYMLFSKAFSEIEKDKNNFNDCLENERVKNKHEPLKKAIRNSGEYSVCNYLYNKDALKILGVDIVIEKDFEKEAIIVSRQLMKEISTILKEIK